MKKKRIQKKKKKKRIISLMKKKSFLSLLIFTHFHPSQFLWLILLVKLTMLFQHIFRRKKEEERRIRRERRRWWKKRKKKEREKGDGIAINIKWNDLNFWGHEEFFLHPLYLSPYFFTPSLFLSLTEFMSESCKHNRKDSDTNLQIILTSCKNLMQT